jgi:branched-subunit amino acid transport protein
MSAAEVWLTLAGMGLVTVLLRLSFIALWGRITLPEVVRDALRYVPPAVLAAIIAPALLFHDGQLVPASGQPRLWAGVLAALIAWRTRNALATIVGGMAALFAFEWLAPLLANWLG